MHNHEKTSSPHLKENKLYHYHPVIITLYAILALYAHNIREVEFSVIVRSLFAAILTTAILLLVFRLVFREIEKAALASTLTLILFFSYGHIYALLKEVSIFSVLIGRHRILAPLWLGLLIIGLWRISRNQRSNDIVHRTLSLVMIIALVSPMVQIGEFFIRTSFMDHQATDQNIAQIDQLTNLPPDEELPDIYYIILDGYTRQDTLREFYGYDNQPFLDTLEEMGFFVASCSQSNYAQTLLSLPSSLNFGYLQDMTEGFIPGNEDRYELWVLLKHSATQKILESMGYFTVAFETGFYWSQLDDADFYLRRSTSELQKQQYLGGLNNFEVLLIKSTMGLIVADGFIALPKALKPNLNSPTQKHQERVLFVLEELEHIPNYPSPKFVFAHIISPHEPFVFDAEGQFIADAESNFTGEHPELEKIPYYTDQITYINSRMEKILETIITNSERPPIIVVQADHGTSLGSRLNILNVYYLPGVDNAILYDKVSPVNTFRMIFSEYFNMDTPLLEDRGFLSSYVDPFDVEEIPNRCEP
jgi:hypothetical protein